MLQSLILSAKLEVLLKLVVHLALAQTCTLYLLVNYLSQVFWLDYYRLFILVQCDPVLIAGRFTQYSILLPSFFKLFFQYLVGVVSPVVIGGCEGLLSALKHLLSLTLVFYEFL